MFFVYRLTQKDFNSLKKRKGKPPEHLLKQYVRGKGFIVRNKETGEIEYSRETPATRGGLIICKEEINNRVLIGEASCSLQDSFNYRLGKTIALGRTLSQDLSI